MRPSHSNLSVPVLMPVQWTLTTQSVLWGSGNSTGRKRISPGCSKTTAVDIAPMAVLSFLFSTDQAPFWGVEAVLVHNCHFKLTFKTVKY